MYACVSLGEKIAVGNATLLVINAYFHILLVYVILNENCFYTFNLLKSHSGFHTY